jgi:hypothetical protein
MWCYLFFLLFLFVPSRRLFLTAVGNLSPGQGVSAVINRDSNCSGFVDYFDGHSLFPFFVLYFHCGTKRSAPSTRVVNITRCPAYWFFRK